MPALIVYGMPELIEHPKLFLEALLPDLVCSLQIAVGNVLCLPSNEVSVFFPVDRMSSRLGKELICIVEGLSQKPERSSTLRRQLASAIVSKLSAFALEYLPQCSKVEAIINRFDQVADGFALWERQG